MKNPLRTWQKTALAALLSVFAVGASATTSPVVPVATAPLATENISALDAGDTLSSAWSTSASSIDDVASVEAAAIVLDTGDDSLTYTPASVSSTAHAELSLTFSAATAAPADPTGAQTAITVYSDNGTASYYVWSKGAATAPAQTDAAWVQVPAAVAPTTGTPVSVAFTIDYAKGVVAYVVGGVNAGEYWLATSASQISSLNFQGTGTLTGSIVTKAAATASILPAAGGTETFYATEADALANASSGASLSLWTYDRTNSQWTSSSSTLYKVTLSWPADLASVSYTVDGTAGAALTVADGSYEFYAADGTAIALSGSNAYKTLPASGTVAAADLTVALAPAGIAWYFPQTATAGQDGSAANPYEIDSATALDALRAAVAAGYGANLNYAQTADIDMSAAAPFAGIGTYAANPSQGKPFTGTYDGQNHKISNVTMTARNYGGIFNQVNGGTIQNLTVENLSVVSGATGEYGYAIVGNAGNGATLRNLVAEGSFLDPSTPATHNAAGIVVRASAGGTGTLVDSCTNNAAIYGDYTKLGGICALTQYKNAGGAVTFDGCVNNGTLTSARTSEANSTSAITGIAGIVAYAADATVLKDCENSGTISVALQNQKVGELVGSGGVETNGSLTDQGGNKASADKKMVHTRVTVTGFQYATVANNVATTTSTLAAGKTYLLEGNVASGTVYTLAAAGDSIAFDTSLGYTFGGDVSGATGLTVSNSTANDVITYTAATQTFQIRWIDGDGTVLATDTVDYNDVPAYTGATTPTKAADAQYTYTFANAWSPAIVAATADADYTAQFSSTVNTYAITWKDGDGNQIYVDTVAYGTVPAYDSTTYGTPTKAATAQYSYTFDAWDVAPVAVTGDATYSATFTSTVNRYTVTWEDGSGNVLETDANVPYGDSPSYDGATPTKASTVAEDYTFSGWLDGNGNAVADPVVGNATYIAQFTASARPYTISWDTDGDGNVDDTTTVDYGDTPAHADGSKASTAQFSYTFSGWLGANNGTGIAAVTGAETYTAQFTQTTREYLVTFFDEDGTTEITRESVAYGSTPTYAGVPTKASTVDQDFTFAGWTPTVGTVTADTSYTATYTATTRKYKIYWVDYDGSSIATDDVAYGTVPTAPANPTRAPDAQYTYAFAAWSPAVVAVTGTATYTATYTSTLRTYTILWVVNGTTVETDANVAYGATPSYDGATPTKASTTLFTYTFSGWSPATAAVTGDATYTAQFEAVSRLRPPVLRLADPTLSAVSMNGPSMVVSGEVSSESEGEIVIVADPTATLSDIDSEGAFTARFPDVAWNQPIAWNLSASVGNSETATLPGRAFNKAETQWFSKAADALDTVTGFGDIEAGVAPENASDPGQQVRIQTVLDISASGSTETPDVGNARGGLAVLALNDEDAAYYAFTGDSSKGTNGWVKLYGATPVDGDADLLIVADMDTLDARYYIDGVALYALENEAPVYAISIGGSDKTLSAIGFANPDGVKAPVVAEYDVPYVAAIGNTAYTTPEAAVAALVAANKAIANDVAIDLLANGVSGSVALADGEAVTVNAGTFTSGLTFTAPAGYKVVQNGSTYTVEPDTATVIWVVEGRDNVTETYAIGATPEYPEDAAAPAKAATAQHTYTFLGWNTDSTATTALSSLAPVAAGGATYYAVFSSSVNSYEITWTDHSGTVKTETLEYGATPTAPAAAPAQYVENGLIYTGTWPTPADVTGTTTYAAVYDAGTPAVATVLYVADGAQEPTVRGTYASLAEAFAAAQDGDTVQLLANVTLTDRLFVNAGASPAFAGSNNRYATTSENKALTLDLNGYDITSASNIALAGGSLTVTGEGTIATMNAGLAPIEIRGTGDLTSKRTLVVGENVTLDGGEYGLNVFGSNDAQKNLIDVTVNGTVEGTLFVLGNLTNDENEIDIVVNGTIAAPAGTGDDVIVGIALNGNAAVTVNDGASISGDTGIEVRAGSLTVNGGEITANADAYSYKANGSGSSTKGAAVAVAQHSTRKAVDVALDGGTFTGPVSVAVVDPENGDPANVAVALTGGTFAGDVVVDESAASVGSIIPATVEVEGVAVPNPALFSDADADGVPEGYALVEVEGSNPPMYAITPKATVIWIVDGTETTESYAIGETPVYPGATPTKAGTDSAVYTFTGWEPAIGTVTAAGATYTAQFSSIYLDPASLELYPNCSNYVHVIGAPEGSTGYFKFAGAAGSGGFNRTELWGKPYGKTPGGTGTVTAYVTNNNEQVAMLVANVTVKDVVAVVDGVEYATADWETAVAAAIQSGSVLEAYYRVANITLPEGKTLRWKAADNRKNTSLIVLAPAATAEAMYKVTSTTDSATGVKTAVCTNEGAPNVMIAKANGTVSYAASFSFSAGATNTVLRDFASARTSVNVMNAVIDLNGHTVTFDTGDTAYAGIMVGAGNVSKGSLTIRDTSAEGTGSIVDSGIPVWVAYNASSVTIESGSIVAGGPAVYGSTASGTITITGGSFETTGNAGFLLNMLDSARGTITVTGGSFQGFDPANNVAEGAGTSFLPATGYVSVADDPSSGWYTVYEAVTVSFVNGKGAAPADQVIGKGKTATAPAAPEAEGFTFDGWFAPNAETAFDFTTPVTADLTLTAQWTEDVVEYVGAKAENGFVILDKDDPAAAGKQLAFTKFEIKGSTVEAAISAALANPNDANTATVKAVYTATLDASAAKVYVNATVTHIDVAKGTATVTFALPAGNAAFFRGFADYDAGTDKP